MQVGLRFYIEVFVILYKHFISVCVCVCYTDDYIHLLEWISNTQWALQWLHAQSALFYHNDELNISIIAGFLWRSVIMRPQTIALFLQTSTSYLRSKSKALHCESHFTPFLSTHMHGASKGDSFQTVATPNKITRSHWIIGKCFAFACLFVCICGGYHCLCMYLWRAGNCCAGLASASDVQWDMQGHTKIRHWTLVCLLQ